MILVLVVVPLLPLLISWRWDWWEAWVYAMICILGFVISRALAARRRMHTASLPPALRRALPQETYTPLWRERVRAFQARLREGPFQDPSRRTDGLDADQRSRGP